MITKKLSHKKSTLFSWTAMLLLSGMMALSVLMYLRHARQGSDVIVHQEIMQLQGIFKNIQKDCYIVSFDHVINHIDFLNVISFAGSKVGSMNLAFAKRWQGPYLKNNPTIHEKTYAVLKNKQGYFVVPGDGVVLDNGKVIGKDIVLNYDTDMQSLMSNPEMLKSKFGSLAAEIIIGSGSMTSMSQYPDIFQSID